MQRGCHVGDQQGTAGSLEDAIALTGLMGRWEGEGRGGKERAGEGRGGAGGSGGEGRGGEGQGGGEGRGRGEWRGGAGRGRGEGGIHPNIPLTTECSDKQHREWNVCYTDPDQVTVNLYNRHTDTHLLVLDYSLDPRTLLLRHAHSIQDSQIWQTAQHLGTIM